MATVGRFGSPQIAVPDYVLRGLRGVPFGGRVRRGAPNHQVGAVSRVELLTVCAGAHLTVTKRPESVPGS